SVRGAVEGVLPAGMKVWMSRTGRGRSGPVVLVALQVLVVARPIAGAGGVLDVHDCEGDDEWNQRERQARGCGGEAQTSQGRLAHEPTSAAMMRRGPNHCPARRRRYRFGLPSNTTQRWSPALLRPSEAHD